MSVAEKRIKKIDRDVMTVSHRPPMNEELLSAYLDNEVTDEERALVEAAIATDPVVAWQVDSLRQTIQMLQELPALSLPRAFTLEAIVSEAKQQEKAKQQEVVPVSVLPSGKKPAFAQQASKGGQPVDWWQWLQQIWQGGNLPLRNAAAFAFALMLVLFVSNRFAAPYQPVGLGENAPSIRQTTSNGTGGDNRTANSTSTAVVAQDETTPIVEPSAKAPATQPPVAVAAIQEQASETASEKLSGENETTAESAIMTQREPLEGPGPDEDTLSGDSPDGSMQTDRLGNGASTMQDSSRSAATASVAPPGNASASLTTSVLTTVTTAYRGQNETAIALTPTITGLVTETVAVETMTPSVTLSTDISDSLESSTPIAAVDNEVITSDRNVKRWLGWAQLITTLCAVVLGGLWWRSRE